MHISRIAAAIVAISTVSLVHASGDETLNIFGSFGAGFGMGGELYSSYTQETAISPQEDVKDRFFNYGSGVKLDAGCQYYLMENLALQGSFGYSVGLQFKDEKAINGVSTTTTTFHRHLFGLKALVVPRFEVLDLLDLYAGAGLGFFWNACPFKTTVKTTPGTQEASGKIISHPALGLLGEFGVNYPLNDKLTLFGEVGFEQISFDLGKYVVEKSNLSLTSTGTQYYSKNDANNLDPKNVPGSNFQIRAGVRFTLL